MGYQIPTLYEENKNEFNLLSTFVGEDHKDASVLNKNNYNLLFEYQPIIINACITGLN